jgi:hypothetical protein
LAESDFDLQAALRARSTTPPEEKKACPECGRCELNIRPPGSGSRGAPRREGDGRYRCHWCGWTGDDTITQAEAAERFDFPGRLDR